MPGGTALSFEYDNLGRLVRIPGYFGPESQPAQKGLAYDANGFLTNATAVNGVSSAYAVDAQGRLKTISITKQQPAESILHLAYSYTPQGNVSCISGTNGGSPFELGYGYDWASRLTSAQVPRPAGISTVKYQYDGAGNRTSETWVGSGTVQYGYDPGNYLKARGAANYTWGPYGQLISKTEGALTTEYGYSAQRLMNAVKVGGAATANYEYDALGRRVKAVEGDATVITLHSEHDIVYEVREVRGLSIPPGEIEIPLPEPGEPLPPRPPRPPRTPAPEYDVTVTCYLALNGKYLAKIVRENANPAQTYFLHADMVGSIRAITDSAGQVVARFEYEPFGLLTTSTGPMAAGAHRFTGKPGDGATELYYFGARYYDPEVERFIYRDPICYGLNWYSYCSLNPLAYCDPNGLREEPRAGSGVIQSEQELFVVEIQEKFQGFIWDSRNPAPFHTQFFAWLNYHPEERQRVWRASGMAQGASGLSWHTVGLGIWGVSQGVAEWLAAYRLLATSSGRIGPVLAGFSMLECGTWSLAVGFSDVAAGLVGEPSLNTQLRTAVGGQLGLTLERVPESNSKWMLLTIIRISNWLRKEDTRIR